MGFPSLRAVMVIAGRASETASIATFLDDAPGGPIALVLEGEPGIGKTVLWTRAVEDARRRDYRVMSCRPTGPDAQLSFVALGDLFAANTEPLIEALPEPQREALEVALLRRRRGRTATDPRAAAVATLGVLRAAAAEAPTIIAIDDVQWIDAATGRVLTFALRRLLGERIGILLGRAATGEATPLGLADAIDAERFNVLHVGPLGAHEIGIIVRDRTGVRLSKPDLGRLAELSGGNPFYALEIARARERGDEGVTGQRLPIPKSLQEDLVRARVASVTSKTRDVLLFAASISRPTVDSLRNAIPTDAVDAGLQGAIDAGLVEVLGSDIRFTHPLYRSAIYADASRRRRHEMHARLAKIMRDPEERALHLALAMDGPDETLAAEIEAASSSARGRGAPEAAVDLLEHAVRLTPRDDLASVRRRLLLSAQDGMSAGDGEGARERAREALRLSAPGVDQAEPLRRIGAIEFAHGALAEARATLDEALAQADEDDVACAEIHRELARVGIRSGEIGAAERHVAASLERADRADDDGLTSAISTTEAEVDLLVGRSSPSLTRILGGDVPPDGSISDSPELIAALAEAFAGQLDRSEMRLGRLLRRSRERGDEPGRLLVTIRLAELRVRAGSWNLAAALANEARELALDLGTKDCLELGLMAYSAAGGGRTEEARLFAEQGLRDSAGDRPAQIWNLAALGFLELSLTRYNEALRQLGRAGGLLAESGIADPCAFPFLADEAEALIGAGELATASRRIAAFEEMGERLDRDLIRGQAARCRGLASAAEGDVPASLRELERAVEIHAPLGIAVEFGRSLFALGVSRRRDRQKRAAREVLEQALEAFTEIDTPLWADRVREEVSRIGGRRTTVGELTESEARVARLAAAGLTNREIARTLSMSVRTAEGHLSHVYAKLELRSRTELAAFDLDA
jgi:DNA-binding CsgD family transcriptional regulator